MMLPRPCMCLFLLFLVLLLPLISASAFISTIPEDTFDHIKNNNVEQLVIFYRSSDAEAEKTLRTVEKAIPKIRASVPQFQFVRCDGDKPENTAQFKEAQFNSGVFIFTSTPVEGIVKYTLPVTVKELTQYVMFKYLPFNESDVLHFTTEDDLFDRMDLTETPRPIFIKFYEEWCQHCKRLKPTFQRAATFFHDRVDFMEVECSHDTHSQSFCTYNEVHSFPVLMLFTGEKKIKFEEENRNIASFQKFFKQHIDGYKIVKMKKAKKVVADNDDDTVAEKLKATTPEVEVPVPSTPPSTSLESSDDTTPTKKKSKKKKKVDDADDDDDEDEEAAAAARAARRKAKREAAEKKLAEAEAKKRGKKKQEEEEPVIEEKKTKKKKKVQEKKKKSKKIKEPEVVPDVDLSNVGEFSLAPEEDEPVKQTQTTTSTPTSTPVTSSNADTKPKDVAARLDALESTVNDLKFMLQQQQALLQQLLSK